MLVYLIILSLTTVSHNYAAVIVKQESYVRRVRDESKTNKYPFLAYVNIGNDSCAGAVLSDSWVVTARACGNSTAQEPGWVYAGSDANIQKRRVTEQLSCPEEHRLLLLHLEVPFTLDDGVSAVPIVRPGTFSGHEGTCDVITFGAEPSETNMKTAHAVETTLVAGSQCTGSASDSSAVVPRKALGAPSSDTPYNGTTDNAAITVVRNQTHSSDEINPKISGDSGKTKKRDILGLESVPTEIADANLLCSPEINEEAASLKHLGSPVICKGVLIALVTPKPFNDASREKKEDPKTYYTAIGPDYSWILQKVPGVQVVSWNEVAKEGRSVRSETADSFPAESRVHKMHLKNARRRRLSHLANINTAIAPDKSSSEDSKLELYDDLGPHLSLNKIFSLWFPLASRVRGIILLNRLLLGPHNDLWGDVAEKAEAALRPLRRVKRSSLEQDAEGSTGDVKASPPMLQPWNFRRAKREGKSKRQPKCADASGDRSKRSTSDDIAESVPCVTESRAQYGTTRLAQRLAVRDRTSRAPQWKFRQGSQAPTA